jgi:hypothetical protein
MTVVLLIIGAFILYFFLDIYIYWRMLGDIYPVVYIEYEPSLPVAQTSKLDDDDIAYANKYLRQPTYTPSKVVIVILVCICSLVIIKALWGN